MKPFAFTLTLVGIASVAFDQILAVDDDGWDNNFRKAHTSFVKECGVCAFPEKGSWVTFRRYISKDPVTRTNNDWVATDKVDASGLFDTIRLKDHMCKNMPYACPACGGNWYPSYQ